MDVLRTTSVSPQPGFHEGASAREATPSVETAQAVRKIDDPWKTSPQLPGAGSLSRPTRQAVGSAGVAAPGTPVSAAPEPATGAAPQITTTKLNENAVPEQKKAATGPNGLYNLDYDIPGAGNGLASLTFPISIDKGLQRVKANDAGHYYAMQFDVNNLEGKNLGTGYIGLQPRADGKALVTFSGFGSHFTAPKGRAGADGGSGASNSTTIDFQFGHKYALMVERDPTDHSLLKGYVQDVTDPENPGTRQHVKDLQLDEDALLAGRQSGFIEHYGKKAKESSDLGRTAGSFYAPSGKSVDDETIEGSLTDGTLYGRYKHSLTGERETTKVGSSIVQVKVDIHGATDPARPPGGRIA